MDDLLERRYNNYQVVLEKMEKQDKYLNFGYESDKNQTLQEKQKQLCMEVFSRAKIKPDDVIVDVGFGSGEQDFLLAELYDFKHLYGFNISKKQVEYAQLSSKKRKLDNKMTFYHGKAEDLTKIEDSSVDKIIAIECAFHFDRPFFYKEAARILKKGGFLVLADIFFFSCFKFLTKYSEKFKRAGTIFQNKFEWERYFITSTIENITKHAMPGAQEAARIINKSLPSMDPTEKIFWKELAKSSLRAALFMRFKISRYDIIVLEK